MENRLPELDNLTSVLFANFDRLQTGFDEISYRALLERFFVIAFRENLNDYEFDYFFSRTIGSQDFIKTTIEAAKLCEVLGRLLVDVLTCTHVYGDAEIILGLYVFFDNFMKNFYQLFINKNLLEHNETLAIIEKESSFYLTELIKQAYNEFETKDEEKRQIIAKNFLMNHIKRTCEFIDPLIYFQIQKYFAGSKYAQEFK